MECGEFDCTVKKMIEDAILQHCKGRETAAPVVSFSIVIDATKVVQNIEVPSGENVSYETHVVSLFCTRWHVKLLQN